MIVIPTPALGGGGGIDGESNPPNDRFNPPSACGLRRIKMTTGKRNKLML